MARYVAVAVGLCLAVASSSALADAPHEYPPPPAAPAAKPPPYSLPFQLRPAIAVSVVRSDTTFAFYKDPTTGNAGNTIATTLLASYKVTPEFTPFVRGALVRNHAPVGDGATVFANPAFGAAYAIKPTSDLRLAMSFAMTAPIGQGGGDTPDKAKATAVASGVNARSAMDNALFAVDYFTMIPGIDFAWLKSGLTVQVEATLLQLMRVRGISPDKARTNLTMGIHVGYFLIPQLSVGVELRHQRWLSTPVFVEASAAARDTTTAALGLRAHIALGGSRWLRPGIAYAQAFDDPMKERAYRIVQLDVPFVY